MKAYLITGLVFVVVWLVAWFAFIRPLLRRYDVITGLEARIAAVEGWPRKALVWLEAKKTLAVTFAMSAIAGIKGATDMAVSTVSGIGGADLAPLRDKTMWSAFFNDIWTMHILAALSVLAAFLTLRGKVTAAQIVPKG